MLRVISLNKFLHKDQSLELHIYQVSVVLRVHSPRPLTKNVNTFGEEANGSEILVTLNFEPHAIHFSKLFQKS